MCREARREQHEGARSRRAEPKLKGRARWGESEAGDHLSEGEAGEEGRGARWKPRFREIPLGAGRSSHYVVTPASLARLY